MRKLLTLPLGYERGWEKLRSIVNPMAAQKAPAGGARQRTECGRYSKQRSIKLIEKGDALMMTRGGRFERSEKRMRPAFATCLTMRSGASRTCAVAILER